MRPLPRDLEPGQRTQVAFAVWDGEHDEVGETPVAVQLGHPLAHQRQALDVPAGLERPGEP